MTDCWHARSGYNSALFSAQPPLVSPSGPASNQVNLMDIPVTNKVLPRHLVTRNYVRGYACSAICWGKYWLRRPGTEVLAAVETLRKGYIRLRKEENAGLRKRLATNIDRLHTRYPEPRRPRIQYLFQPGQSSPKKPSSTRSDDARSDKGARCGAVRSTIRCASFTTWAWMPPDHRQLLNRHCTCRYSPPTRPNRNAAR